MLSMVPVARRGPRGGVTNMAPVISPVEVRSVLLATDLSQASAKPLRHALAIARYFGAKFYLAHVVSSVGLTMAGPDAIDGAEQAVCRDAARLEDDLVRRGGSRWRTT